MTTSQLFQTKTGTQFKGVTPDARAQFLSQLEELGITRAQVVEAASYSFAMVVRYALGLSAQGGRVCAIVGDTIAGEVALATLRHLVNAGAEGAIFLPKARNTLSPSLSQQLIPLEKMGVPFAEHTPGSSQTTGVINESHNVLCGFYEGNMPGETALINALNDAQTPIHTVESPLGIDPTTGAKSLSPLFASSTLSLGAPLVGLNPGAECVGRHYVCDISLTREMYRAIGDDLTPLFSEQPVIQITPVSTDQPA